MKVEKTRRSFMEKMRTSIRQIQWVGPCKTAQVGYLITGHAYISKRAWFYIWLGDICMHGASSSLYKNFTDISSPYAQSRLFPLALQWVSCTIKCNNCRQKPAYYCFYRHLVMTLGVCLSLKRIIPKRLYGPSMSSIRKFSRKSIHNTYYSSEKMIW